MEQRSDYKPTRRDLDAVLLQYQGAAEANDDPVFRQRESRALGEKNIVQR